MHKYFKRTNTPLDTNIVYLYRFLIIIMLVLFAYCKYRQMEYQSPSCSGSGIINLEHRRMLKVCITTAAFVDYKGQKKYTNGLGLYLPAALITIALLYCIPQQYQNYYEDKILVALFEKAPHLPRAVAIRNIDVIIMYNYRLLSTRVRLSWECLEVNFYVLLILDVISSTNLMSKIMVGGVTEGWNYVMDMWNLAYPINVKCEIGPQMVYAASNTKHFRCIIPHNEFYKYIWMVAVIVALIAMILSFVSLVYHMVQMLPFGRKQLFQGTVDIDKQTLEILATELPGGDDTLFLLKSYLLRLPSKEQRKSVLWELLTIIKETCIENKCM